MGLGLTHFFQPLNLTTNRATNRATNQQTTHGRNMGKLKQQKRNKAAADDLPYGRPNSNVFKFNTNLGQHILKNPGGLFFTWLSGRFEID